MMRKSIRFFSRENSKFIVPALLAVFLFTVAVFGVVLPNLRSNLIEQKKKQMTVLTQTTWNILAHYENEVLSGTIALDVAQKSAKEQIRKSRYGPEGKDYFWINDFRPFMVLHPYFPELEGKDLSDFTDLNGTFLFKEFVDKAQKEGEGFVPYMWQWNDAPGRISPKFSYIKSFEPWGWIIGTGVYLDEVSKEIDIVSRKLFYLLITILLIVTLLLARIVSQSTKEIEKRQIAEVEVQKYHNKLEGLVEIRTAELQKALNEVKTLQGILPICSFCKSIRDDKGYWNQVEAYVSKYTDAKFSHGYCPACFKEHYPEYYDEAKSNINRGEY